MRAPMERALWSCLAVKNRRRISPGPARCLKPAPGAGVQPAPWHRSRSRPAPWNPRSRPGRRRWNRGG
ncbi:hypothetical protein G6F56_014670 [Rhizopus delemar]|nr:hypothetical protein G6F56_014670 [Rhizopus delemar]